MITLKQLLADFTPLDVADMPIQGLTDRSTALQRGDVFFALPGVAADGRHFIGDALKKGAAAIVYAADDGWQPNTTDANVPMIPLLKLRENLGKIAARFHNNPSQNLDLIAWTGTNGKTSGTQFVAQALQFLNNHNHCGVIGTLGYGFLPTLTQGPNTMPGALELQQQLANLRDQGAQAVAMEISSHGLTQERAAGCQIVAAVFTQLSRDHLDYHQTMQAYGEAKARLFAWPGLQHAIINLDDAWGQELIKRFRKQVPIVGYTLHRQQLPADILSDIQLLAVQDLQLSVTGFQANVQSPWGLLKLDCPLLGEFNVSNVLGVVGVLGCLGYDATQISQALKNVTPVAGRMQFFSGQETSPTVVVDYAHTPDALEKVLRALRPFCQGKLWCVFGCGGDRDRGKRPVMLKTVEKWADCPIVTNDNPRHEAPEQILADMFEGARERAHVRVELDRTLAIEHAIGHAQPQDIVVVAGKGHEPYQIIGSTYYPFDDRMVVQQCLQKKLKI